MREKGYYWVKTVFDNEWTIAEWNDGEWWLCGMEGSANDDYFSIISQRIKNPDERA